MRGRLPTSPAHHPGARVLFAVAASFLIVAAAGVVTPGEAQVTLCSDSHFAATSGATACSGTVTVTATVVAVASLRLDLVFGTIPGVGISFGTVDAQCLSLATPGLNCSANSSAVSSTWYGDVQFTVRTFGLAGRTVKLTGIRSNPGSVPSGALLDGVSGAAPTSTYPDAGGSALALRTGIGGGQTTVTRSLGLRITASDVATLWTGSTVVYALVVE